MLSELAILGWRSSEQAAHMRNKIKSRDNESEDVSYQEEEPRSETQQARPARRKRRKEVDGIVPKGLPDRFYNEDGEVDLRQVSGKDVLKYFGALGIPLPIFSRADGK